MGHFDVTFIGMQHTSSEVTAGVVYEVTGEVEMRAIVVSETAGKRPIIRWRPGTVLRRTHSLLLLCGIAAVSHAAFVPTAAIAQTAPSAAAATNTPAPSPAKHHKKAQAAPVAAPVPPPQPTVAPNLLDQPATPATVTANNNELTVKAENSSLSQILHQVSSATGMKLEGLGGDERVFGSFGPAAPREVITALLDGTSYNVLMVGDLPNGAPRQLLLTRKASGAGSPSTASANGAPNPNQAHNGDEENPDDNASPDDSSDDTAPPMQYTPPSIAPAEPPPSTPSNSPSEAPPPRSLPQLQNAPQ
jgi:hypothetical protein